MKSISDCNIKETSLNNVERNLNLKHFLITPFIEIAPLNYDIKNSNQKDLSSIPISEVNFPKVVYMIVEKNIELQIKYLKDFPDWQFLSKNELNRKTIEIHEDLKMRKDFAIKIKK